MNSPGTLFGVARALFALLCLTPLAQAGPAEDVERGSGIQITQFSFSVHGHYESGNVFLFKAPDTLDAVIDARAFGLGVDLRIPLRGTRSGDTITWSFDVTPAPAIDIGWPHSIARVRGALVVQAALLPGGADPRCGGTPCPYNVQMTSLPGSWTTVTVRGLLGSGDHRVEDIRLIAHGGLPRPRLQQFTLNRPAGRFCSRTSETYLSGRVTIARRAPTGGAWVTVGSSDPVHARVMGVNIREGEQSAPVGIYIAAEWSGRVRLTASAGGVIQTSVLDVSLPSACSPAAAGWLISEVIAACPLCMRPVWLNDPGDLFGDLAGKQAFLGRGWPEARPLGNLFCNSTPSTPFRCEACGHIGQPTCNNMLCVTGVASGGRCVAPGGGGGGGDMMCNGSITYVVGVRSYLSRCGVANYTVRANSRADARTCAERAARADGVADVEAIDETLLRTFDRTATNMTNQCSVYHPLAYSEEDADRCVQYFCLNCTVARQAACPRR